MDIPRINNWQEFNNLSQEIFNITLTDKCQEKINLFYNHLKETNKKFNLTRLIELDDFLTFHLFDTLSLIYFTLNNKITCRKYLDIGSGCGVPSILFIIIAQENPELKLKIQEAYLCESIGKKAKFLEKSLGILKYNKFCTVLNSNSNLLDRKYKNYFGLVTARAVAKMPKAINLCQPFLHKTRGYYLAQTTESISSESTNTLHFTLDNKNRYITAVGKLFKKPQEEEPAQII